MQAKHSDRFCLVKPVDPNDPAVADIIADWKAKKGTVGVRVIMGDDVSADPADPGANRVLAAAADALDGGKPAVLEPVGAGRTIGGRQSEHAARHRPSGPTAAVRAAATAPLGRFAKGAGARSRSQCCHQDHQRRHIVSHEPFPYKDIWDPLAHIFDAFTFDRCMWGTDARGQIADLQRGGRGVPRYRPAVRRRPRQADGRHGEPHLRVVAVKGLSADPEGIVAAPTFGGRGSS